MRVQDPCIGDDSEYFDQCCSCRISMVYLEELGSLRMLCVRDSFLRRLYCSIAIVLALLSTVILSRTLFLLASVLLTWFLLHRVFCIRYAMLGGVHRILHIWCCCRSPTFRVPFPHSCHIFVHSYSVSRYAQICST